ncbi:MAG: carbohydrate kinase [Bacteroidetes bacterium]|nr:carbohydrate kinase [Bacteroidota bacterium]
MAKKPVIAIFDVGKTNKKLCLFDEDYNIVFEKSAQLKEITDEDGFPCEDVDALESFIFNSLSDVGEQLEFELKAINFSAYGASFVLTDERGHAIAPLYNYLKPYPEELSQKLYEQYGGKEQFSAETASPALGSLNSGLQLFRLKNERPDLFKKLKYALHLPQYLSSLLTGHYYSDITSIGCHTALWDFRTNDYHQWVKQEGILPKLAPIQRSDKTINSRYCAVGIGLHDSSAALIPYLESFKEPFVLISTGTWSISMNPFNHSPLTTAELQQDCLCYLSYKGAPVKSSRLFAGHEHDETVKQIAEQFHVSPVYFKNLTFDKNLDNDPPTEAYQDFMRKLVQKQVRSTNLVLTNDVKRIFVDGGFSHNEIFMQLLANAYPGINVYAASMAQASALGAAICIHSCWNTKPLSKHLVQLKHYKPI